MIRSRRPLTFSVSSALLAGALALTACGDEEVITNPAPENNSAANNSTANNSAGNNSANNGLPSNNSTANNNPANNSTANNSTANNSTANNSTANNSTANNSTANNSANNNDAVPPQLRNACERYCAKGVTCGTEDDELACVNRCIASPDVDAIACHTDNEACADVAACIAALEPVDPDPQPTGACADYDPFEPNDDAATATPLLGADTSFVGLCPGDADWYAVTVDTPNTLLAYLEAIPIDAGDPTADITVEIRDADGVLVTATPFGDDLTADWTPEATTALYIVVRGAPSAPADGFIYDLDTLIFDAN